MNQNVPPTLYLFVCKVQEHTFYKVISPFYQRIEMYFEIITTKEAKFVNAKFIS